MAGKADRDRGQGQTRNYRCAIYTRKSSEEGLEQDFNSLQAQREACEAFICSQRGEGWKLFPTAYDDGGISGGTMDRPALRRMLADIESGLVDVVVVYKVDRLTRSLSDFSKMVEVFDRQGVSFVAVTQQFNTTTSMGRLTLNVLLSFAQFEREVTGERIRDKIAASKRKGIWMGGPLPLGYRVEDRRLIVVPDEAETVRAIFQLYLECSSVRELALTLRRKGLKPRAASSMDFSRGALLALLRNPIYIGQVRHRAECFQGLHEGIVEQAIWDAVQAKLDTSAQCRGRPVRKTDLSPLMGKLFDERGRLLTPSHATKNGKRYRYYTSHPDDRDDDRHHRESGSDWRLPAAQIEGRVAEMVSTMVQDRTQIFSAVSTWEGGTTKTEDAVDALLSGIQIRTEAEALSRVQRVDLLADHLKVAIVLGDSKPIRLEKIQPMTAKRRGCERRIVIESQVTPRQIDAPLMRALSRGLRFWDALNSDQPPSALEFARAEGTDNRYIGRSLRLAFLAPDIVEAIVAGRQPADWTAERFLRWERLPLSWNEQRRVLGLG